MVFGNLAALAQSSVRRLLAYSAIAHAGYILLGLAFFSWTNASAQAILYYIVTYGLTTIGAFGVVGVVERATGSDKLDSFLGLHKRNPIARRRSARALSLARRNSAAGRLLGQVQSFRRCSRTSAPARIPFTLVALAIAFSAVSLYYYLQVLKRAYVMPAGDDSPIRRASRHAFRAGRDRRRSSRARLLPGAAAELDRRLLSSDVAQDPVQTQKSRPKLMLRAVCADLLTRRLAAFQYFTIAANESGFRLAPPTSAPSISSWPISAVALSGFTLPP